MKDICSKSKCVGCGLCMVKCPKQCITMEKSLLGHLYPKINEQACINCKLCQKLCPALNTKPLSHPIKAYAAFAKSESEYKSSTSGGMAATLSRYIISKGGVVYGCLVDNEGKQADTLDIRHVRVSEMNNLYRLKGSKYVQSRITEILPHLVDDVKSGIPVLFIGTPCQVAAVRNLFKVEPYNLYLVDLICHGTPSLSLLKNHISRTIGNKEFDDIKFRDGNSMYILLLLQGKIIYSQSLANPRYKEEYFNAFFDGYTYRDSCYTCHFATSDRISDITIGDFWGLGREYDCSEILPHENGISVVLPVTSKGEKLIEEIKHQLNIYERPLEEAISGNDQLQYPKKQDRQIRLFRKLSIVLPFHVSYKLTIIELKSERLLRRVKNKIKRII